MNENINQQVDNIVNYIKEHYENSCIAVNSKQEWFANLTTVEKAKECIDFFYHEKLRWCGCGCPKMALECVYEFLKQSDTPNMERFEELYHCDRIEANPLLLCLAYAMDAAGLTRHSLSILGAIPSDEGKMFLYLLDFAKPWKDEETSEC